MGLLTSPELNLLEYSSRNTGNNYWVLSPNYNGNNYAYVRNIRNGGAMYDDIVYNRNGVRPVISLKPSVEYVYGSGSKTSPYVVETD